MGTPDENAMRQEQEQLRKDCSNGAADTDVCAQWGYPFGGVVTSRPQADVQLQYLCSQGQADAELCRESGF